MTYQILLITKLCKSNRHKFYKILPFISLLIVAFNVVNSGDSVESTNSEYHVVDDFYCEVTARVVHIWHRCPCICDWIIHFAAAHP